MNRNMMKIIAAVLVVSLAMLGCGAQTILAPATETPTATSEPTLEFYAGFTQNEEIPYIAMHQSGESLGAIADADASNIKGVVWRSSDGNSSIVIYADSDGLPISAVVGEDIILYSNYTDDMVDITVLQADGSRQTFQAKRDLDKLNKIRSFLTPSVSMISYSKDIHLNLQQLDQLLYIKQLASIIGAASCLLAVSAPVLPSLAALALPCLGTLITGITLYGNMLGVHVGFLEEFGASWTAFKCPLDLLNNLNPVACISTYATLMQKQKELANQKIDVARSEYVGLQFGTLEFDSVPTNTPTLVPTFTPTPTPVPTNTPQPVSSLRGTVTQLSNCRYGPDWPYLYKYGVGVNTRMEVIGRDADGNWLQVQGIGGHNACWIKSVQIQVDGDVMTLPDTYPNTTGLPISPFFPEISISVSYSGGMVNVSWPDHEIRSDLGTEQGIEYIVEIWTCVDGKPTFYALGFPPGETNASFEIDNSCGMISHADVIGEDKEGFSPPANIVLP